VNTFDDEELKKANESSRNSVQKIKESLAERNWREWHRDDELKKLGRAPELKPRVRKGRPPSYVMQEMDGQCFPIGTDRDMCEIYFKQQWQKGLPVTNKNGRDQNECAVGVALVFNISVQQFWSKYNRVPVNDRKAIELRLLKVLIEYGKVSPKKIKKAEKKKQDLEVFFRSIGEGVEPL
jgi:hypothetical protein